jgi:hypothetical protein
MYVAALLKEGLHTARSLGKWFRDLPHYQEGFGAIFRDPKVQELESATLSRIRDELVFHFDRNAVAIGLSRFPPREFVIATYPEESGPTFGETYFDAADDAVLSYLFGDAPSREEYEARVSDFMDGVTDLLKRFLFSSHRLIAKGLLELGCKKRRAPQ